LQSDGEDTWKCPDTGDTYTERDGVLTPGDEAAG
jgi:hypothetical protein